jgi:hypothetical protein
MSVTFDVLVLTMRYLPTSSAENELRLGVATCTGLKGSACSCRPEYGVTGV